jgi:Fe-S cluster biogenesis protein NfuA
MQEEVQAVIDKIRPMLQADGGDVELVSVDNGVVKVRLQGACRGCPMSQITLKNDFTTDAPQVRPAPNVTRRT